MAISPLALGIGLQGKYDYKHQAMLDLAREKGRAKAEAEAEAAKAKKRAPYERALMKVDTSGLLPYQAKLIKEKYADALQAFEDTPDDYSLHAANMQDINSASKAFRDQAENYKRLSIQQGGMPADVQALKVIGTLSDKDQINQELGKLGPATSIAFANDQFVFDNPKYTGTGESIAKSINSMQFDLLEGAPVITVGDKKFAGLDINKNVPALITANIMSDANRKKSAINDYLQFSIENDIPYDFSTPESTNEFLKNTTAWVQKKAQTDVDTRSKQLNVTPTKGLNIDINMGAGGAISDVINWSEGNKYQFGEEGVPDSYIISEGGALPVTENKTVVLANNDAIWDVESGERITEPNVTNGTYNEPALVYKAKERYRFPETQLKMQDGSYRTLPARTFEKNEPLRGGYAYAMAQKGKAKAGYVAFGIIKDGSVTTKVVRNLGDLGISEFIDASKYKQRQLNDIYKTAKAKKDALQKKIDSYNQASPAPAPTPAPTPTTKKEATKPTAAQTKAATSPAQAKPANAAAAKPPAKVKVKTAEQQASDKRMQDLMNGK